MASEQATPPRLVSLDQFRGYTVVGMLLVNFLGSFAVCPRVLKHTHDYLSYADTIMPQFLFAVGFAMRLSLGRRLQAEGSGAIFRRMAKRLLGLALVALVVYTVGRRAETWEALVQLGAWGAIEEPLKRHWFQTLMHIAVTSLWVLPVIHSNSAVRLLWMLGSAALHVALSHWFNFVWVNTPPNGIDGGPLGFLTWTIPTIVGTLACDLLVNPSDVSQVRSPLLGRAALMAIGLMSLGYVFSCGTRYYDVPESEQVSLQQEKLAVHPVIPSPEQVQHKRAEGHLRAWLAEPPFVAPPSITERKWNYWMMSQRSGSLSYLTFAAGFALFVYLLFFVACDSWGWRLAFFKTFGTNALLAYVVHDQVADAIKPFIPGDAPAWYVLAGLMVFFWITWLFVRSFEKRGMFLRV